jgi:hypothetical protein
VALRPATEQLEAALGNRAYVLRVSIHTEMGQVLGTRYHFETTPLFVLLNAQGREVWRGSIPPGAEQVLSEG